MKRTEERKAGKRVKKQKIKLGSKEKEGKKKNVELVEVEWKGRMHEKKEGRKDIRRGDEIKGRRKMK